VLPPVGKAGAAGAARSNSARARSLAERFFSSDLPQWKRQSPSIIAPQARLVGGPGRRRKARVSGGSASGLWARKTASRPHSRSGRWK
jgi:hypothetical protein